MKIESSFIKQSLLVLGIFCVTTFVTYGAIGTSGGLLKSTPYQVRSSIADADLSRLTNGAGAVILDWVVAKVKAKAEEKAGSSVDITAYNAYIDNYLSMIDQLDNTTGPDYAFIFKYIYPRVYELRKAENKFASIASTLENMIGMATNNSISSTSMNSSNSGVEGTTASTNTTSTTTATASNTNLISVTISWWILACWDSTKSNYTTYAWVGGVVKLSQAQIAECGTKWTNAQIWIQCGNLASGVRNSNTVQNGDVFSCGATGNNVTTTSTQSASTTMTQYPGCTIADITLSNGQTWAACNIGATSPTAYGNYYQWGRNDTESTAGWTTDNWWEGGQGPCATGYHVPVQSDWQTSYNTLATDFINILQLPKAGSRSPNGSKFNQTLVGSYWSSSPSPNPTFGSYLSFVGTSTISPASGNSRDMGYPIRCIRNTSGTTTSVNSSTTPTGSSASNPPTATLTYNGIANNATANVGDMANWVWNSTNGMSYKATYSAVGCTTSSMNTNGEATWSLLNNTANGTISGPSGPEWAGCTFVGKYTVTGKNGDIISASVVLKPTTNRVSLTVSGMTTVACWDSTKSDYVTYSQAGVIILDKNYCNSKWPWGKNWQVWTLCPAGNQHLQYIDGVKNGDVFSCSTQTAIVIPSPLSTPYFHYYRTFDTGWQILSWNTQSVVSKLSWVSTWPNGRQSSSALTTPLNQNSYYTSAADLNTNGWTAGSYSVVWTVTLQDGTVKDYNETFTMPLF